MKINESSRSGDAIEYITETFPELTEGEKQVAAYLLENLESALSMSVHTLAAKAGVSVATVVRYAQHMGFDGYKSFRLHLAQRFSSSSDPVLDFPTTDGGIEDRVTRMLKANTDAIRLTLEEMDFSVLTAAAEAIKNAERLLFFGTGTSNVVCCDAMLKYRRAGKLAFAESDSYNAALIVSGMKPSDVLVAVSHSGRNGDTLRVLKSAKQAGVKTVGITTFSGTVFAEYADLTLYTKTRESSLHNVSISSRISQFAVLDALYMAYLTLDYESCADNNERLTMIMTSLGIL